MKRTISRRQILAGAAVSVLAAPAILRAQDTRVIRVGALKLIHSIGPYFYERFTPAGYKVEVYPFESPTEGKNAVVTQSVDFGMFGVAAALLGASAGEPISVIAGACNKGMAIIAGKNSPISSVKDLKGKRVAIWPGSTQEVFLLERMRMEGLTIKDITPVRVSFSEMHLALARGDIDAYSGAEPGPGVSLSTGVGKLVEYPYSTAMGGLNMVFCAHRETPSSKAELVKVMLGIHRKAVEYATANPAELASMAVTKLGQKPEAIALSVPNVELTWRFGPTQVEQAKTYAQHMLELKQVRRLPDFDAFFQTALVTEMGRVL